jgi:hypothetical protein
MDKRFGNHLGQRPHRLGRHNEISDGKQRNESHQGYRHAEYHPFRLLALHRARFPPVTVGLRYHQTHQETDKEGAIEEI